MGHKLLKLPEAVLQGRDQYGFYDHFTEFTDAQRWTVAVVGTGTAAHEASAGRSAIKLFNTAANDAAVIATTHEIFKMRAGKSMVGEGIVNGADVDTDDGMLFFGWADALAATTLADTTGAVTATDAIALVKLPDTRVLRFHTEINGVALATDSNAVILTSANQILRIEVEPRNSTTLVARPFLDGVQLRTAAGVLISHDIVLGTATDLDFGALTKSNDAADYTVYVEALGAYEVL
jgi:hypothetical protein